MIALADAVFIYGAYGITAVVLGVLAVGVIRRGRDLAAKADDDDMYWK